MAISSPALYLNPRFWPSFSLSSSSSSFISPGSKFFRPGHVCNRLVLTRTRPGNVRRRRFACSCLFGLGVPEIVVIAGVAALVFGPKQLPEIGRSINKTVKSFQQAAQEFESELKKEPESLDETMGTKPTSVREREQENFERSGRDNLEYWAVLPFRVGLREKLGPFSNQAEYLPIEEI